MGVTLAWVAAMWLWAWGPVGTDGKAAGQLYSSLAHVEALFDFDERLGELLNHLPEHIPAATMYLESYRSLQVDRSLGREVRGHPLHVFQVFKRLVLFWPHIAHSLNTYVNLEDMCQNLHPECDNWAMRGNCLHFRDYMIRHCPLACRTCLPPGMRERIMEVMTASNMTMPSENDLRGAANALSNLQVYYRIPINNFMACRIKDAHCTAKLTVDDCLRVAEATHHFGRYGDAWLWYDYCQASAYMEPTLQDNIKATMEKVEAEHDKNFVHGSIDFLPLPLNKTKSQKPWDTPFRKLCRDGYLDQQEDNKERPQLQCHVNNRGSPYLTLQPVRYEHLHTDPEMYLFHDVISDAEIAAVKDSAREKLTRSETYSKTNPVTEERVSHTAWLKNASHPALLRLAHRIADVAQLMAFENTKGHQAAEDLQVLNYGLGGFYNSHNDVLFKSLPEEEWPESTEYQVGDRLATWMFYLSDVTAGGRTAFPTAGVAVSPEKGAAVMWFNIKKNGYFNTKTLHGGCPVLLGEKWVANRWIRENANFLRRPCSTDPLE